MNLMWGEMTDINREEYKQFFLAYHDTVAKSGFTGHRIKPISVLPQSLLAGFEVAVLSKVAQHNYRIMPTFSSNIKMIIMDLLPSSLVQSFIMRRSESYPGLVSLPDQAIICFQIHQVHPSLVVQIRKLQVDNEPVISSSLKLWDGHWTGLLSTK